MVSSSLISKLRKIAVPSNGGEVERCNFCGTTLSEDHRHLVNLDSMQFMCACEMCVILMAENATYKAIPQRSLFLENFEMSNELWSDFRIPVNMAFFVNNSKANGTVAYYPAPTGATESQLKLEPWNQLKELNPILDSLDSDMEALLVNRLDTPEQYFIVPIDVCYKLIGMIRQAWQGISGGAEVNNIIKKFFSELKSKAEPCQS